MARRFWAVAVGSALLVDLTTLGATAKGASWVRVQGPGLARPVTLQPGSGTSDELWPLMADTGFWDEACNSGRCGPGPVRSRRPTESLGPRYTLSYRMDLGGTHDVVQYVYPFAWPRPVTYMPPGQVYMTGYRTDGGWYIARPSLRWMWSDLGLPATLAEATQTPSPSGVPTKAVAHDRSLVPWVVGLLLLFAATVSLALVRIRRHPQSVPL